MINLELNVPCDFYKAETREGFFISSDMKKIWAIQLDLLCKLMNVCSNRGIKIFASGGTLLGAVRHKGFIPWDDDIDVMMFREDYTKLCEIADQEFLYPYFFQTEYNDAGSLRGHAQLRNTKTTAILDFEKGIRSFNQGIFIDIFPLDSVIEDRSRIEKQGMLVDHYLSLAKKCSRCSSRYIKGETKGLKGKVKDFIYPVTNIVLKTLKAEQLFYKKFELACQMYNSIDTPYVSTLSLDFHNQKFYKSRKDFQEIIYLPFEFVSIPVCKNYDHALKKRFGNYHDIVKNGSLHSEVYFDTDKSYIEYLK